MFRIDLELIKNKNFPIFALIAFNLLIGMIIVADFGESWDEEKYIIYAENSLSAYASLGDNLDQSNLGPGNLIYYGPAYITFSKIIQNLLGYLDSDIPSEVIFHFMYFVSFQIGIFSLYVITGRFVERWAAIGATVFFSTQPLLFGHAFINPKDIPFMAFFMATIASGFWLSNSKIIGEEGIPSPKMENLFLTLHREWNDSKSYLLIILRRIGLVISIGVVIFLASGEINLILAGLVEYVLSADPDSPLGSLGAQLAENSAEIALESYVQRGTMIFWRIYSYLMGGIILFFMFVFLRQFRVSSRKLWSELMRPILREFGMSLPKKVWRNLSNPKLIFAGIILGISTSIRVIGPAAGGLVAIYLIYIWRHYSVATIIAYFSVGALVTYVSWPFLWQAPFSRFIESLSLTTNFPWEGKVLFDGVLYSSTELPSMYLPTLLLLQFTEPTALLFLGGLIIAIYFAITRRKNIPGTFILLLWFWMPTLYTIITRPTVYDNFRQLLFIVPPIFVFSGIFLDSIYHKLKHKWIFVLIIAGIITPGVYSSVKLHPYEYIYYNRFIGGLEGAIQTYELDYWATSYKEAMEYVNLISKPKARIIVWGAPRIASNYARDDLSIQSFLELAPGNYNQYEYGIISTRLIGDTIAQIEGEDVFRVARENAVFVTVKRISD